MAEVQTIEREPDASAAAAATGGEGRNVFSGLTQRFKPASEEGNDDEEAGQELGSREPKKG